MIVETESESSSGSLRSVIGMVLGGVFRYGCGPRTAMDSGFFQRERTAVRSVALLLRSPISRLFNICVDYCVMRRPSRCRDVEPPVNSTCAGER